MKIHLVGMGMGNPDGLSLHAKRVVDEADVVLGAARLLQALSPKRDVTYMAMDRSDAIADAIAAHPEWQNVCVVLSGDVGFYSAATRLRKLLAAYAPESICGIASPQYLAARLRRPWQDFKLVSGHGRSCDVLAEVLNHPAVFFLTGGEVTPMTICRQLVEAGLGAATVTVGENLGAPEERMVSGSAGELDGNTFAALSVVLVENKQTFKREVRGPGIPDTAFIRSNIPMTKRELRVNILARLAIKTNDVLYDVGAGTGSVSVEMALLARRGRVYAVECSDEACDLIRQNKERFGTYNLQVVQGMAPEALADLPVPNAAFIGGSRGNLRGIVECLLAKNPHVHLVISAVTLETLHEATETLHALDVRNLDITQIAVTHTQAVGGLNMLRAQNPVFLISGGGERAY